MKKISIIVPCYNEEGNVKDFSEALTDILGPLPYNYEIIFVDNNSTDKTKDILRLIATNDHHIKVIFNNRNYGAIDERSTRNAEHYATGDVIIGIPCDFQEPPELIPEFIKYWEEGYKVVVGQIISEKENKFKFLQRRIYYKIIKLFSDNPQYEGLSGIALYDRDISRRILATDPDYLFRFAIADMGYDVKIIPYQRAARKEGHSHYSVYSYLGFSISSMIATSNTPLRLMTILGVALSITSFFVGIIYLVLKLLYWDHFQAGIAPLLISIFFLGSLQLFFISLVGEYVGAIFIKVSKRPDVIVSETLNFDDLKE